jgi:hypothetical protein
MIAMVRPREYCSFGRRAYLFFGSFYIDGFLGSRTPKASLG